MLDVHILTLPERREKLEACLASVRPTRATVRVLPGVPGHIGRGRFEAFGGAQEPFVTYVDDDDLVVPGLIDEILHVLEANPDTALLHIPPRGHSGRSPLPTGRSPALSCKRMRPSTGAISDHMNVYRRALLQPHLLNYIHCERGGDGLVLDSYLRTLAHPHYILCASQQLYIKRSD